MYTSAVRWGLTLLVGIMVVSGCGEETLPSSISSYTPSSVSPERRAHIYDMAHDYVSGKRDTLENNRRALEEIVSLKGAEARLFHQALDELDTQKPVTEEEKLGEIVYHELVKYADSKGITVMSLPPQDVDQVYKETVLRLHQSGEIKFPLSPGPGIASSSPISFIPRSNPLSLRVVKVC